MVAGDWWLVAPHFAASRLTGGPGVLSLLFSQGVINDAVSIVLFDASLKQGVQMIAENDGAGPSNVRLSFCLHLYFPGHCSDSSFEPYGVWVYGSWVGVGVAQRQRQRSFCLYLCLCLSVFLCLSFVYSSNVRLFATFAQTPRRAAEWGPQEGRHFAVNLFVHTCLYKQNIMEKAGPFSVARLKMALPFHSRLAFTGSASPICPPVSAAPISPSLDTLFALSRLSCRCAQLCAQLYFPVTVATVPSIYTLTHRADR